MKLSVGATRMELLRLRKRRQIAERGHKLLKDKQEELMRRIMSLVEEIRGEREQIGIEWTKTLNRFRLSQSLFHPQYFDEALLYPGYQIGLTLTFESVLNIKIPVFTPEFSGKFRAYGFLTTSGELDFALKKFQELTERLIKLAGKEKGLELLAEEMEKTRRRVNALEYVLIPSIIETIKFIKLKLEETERTDLTRLMRIKEIIRG